MILTLQLDQGPPWYVAVGSFGKSLQIGAYVDQVLIDPDDIDSAVLLVSREIYEGDPISYALTTVADSETVNLVREWELGDEILETPGVYVARVRVNVGGEIMVFPDGQFRIIVS